MMFKLDADGERVHKLGTGEWHSVEASSEYRNWLAAGNIPEAADSVPVQAYQEPALPAIDEKAAAKGTELVEATRGPEGDAIRFLWSLLTRHG